LVGKAAARPSQVIELSRENVHSIWPASQTLRVVAGRLWVSLNGLDLVLDEGGELYLPDSNPYPAVLSNLSKRTVFYEIK
jgi:glyoxylate utilization-related uncharacterized protein